MKLPWWVKAGAILAALIVGLSLTSLVSYGIEGSSVARKSPVKISLPALSAPIPGLLIWWQALSVFCWTPYTILACSSFLLLAAVFVTGSAVFLLRAARKAFLAHRGLKAEPG